MKRKSKQKQSFQWYFHPKDLVCMHFSETNLSIKLQNGIAIAFKIHIDGDVDRFFNEFQKIWSAIITQNKWMRIYYSAGLIRVETLENLANGTKTKTGGCLE